MPDPVTTHGDAPAAPTEPPAPPPSRRVLSKTARDVTLSMGLVAIIIFAAMAISWRPQPDPVREVDSRPVAEAVAQVAKFPVLAPQVPAGWRATSARWEPTTESGDAPVWFNGWVTDTGEFAAVVQSTATSAAFVKEQTGGAYPAKPEDVTVPGWRAYWSLDGETRSLVRQRAGVTTVVTSTMDWPALVAFRDSLREVEAPG